MAVIERVTDLSGPETDIYTGLSEAALLHYFEPAPGLFIAESGKVIRRALEAGYEPYSFFIEEDRLAEAAPLYESFEGTVYTAPREIMIRLTGYMLTQGILCAFHRPPAPKLESFLEKAHRLVLLEDVENPTNVGAIFRSAAALGMDGLILTGGSADPLYRRASRVSMGTVFQMPHLKCPSGLPTKDLLLKMKEMGYTVFGLALNDRTVSLRAIDLKAGEKAVLLLGNEDHGLAEETMSFCDSLLKIPMAHGVDSLNVSNAAAIAFYALTERR